MRIACRAVVAVLIAWGGPGAALADSDDGDGDDSGSDTEGTGEVGPAADDSGPDPEELMAEIEELNERLEFLDKQVQGLLPVKSRISGYLDVGFFATSGDGSGTRRELDFGEVLFPEFDGISTPGWVFVGDPLSTAINARGEPATTGESRAVVFDSVASDGKPTFIVNAVNLALFTGLGENLQLNAMVDFLPRSRNISNPDGLFLGDYIDVKLAYAEWRPDLSDSLDVTFTAGKADSVLGYEYRSQEAPDRLPVTPSLICRYTCGRPLGAKARVKALRDRLIANLAVTNGSHFWEGFDFADEIDSNALPTVAGRLSFGQPAGNGEFEIGASGAYGAQDAQQNSKVRQFHLGVDLHATVDDLEITAEYVWGRARGSPRGRSFTRPEECENAPCLRYQGAYGLAGYRVTNLLIPYLRVDWRDAVHRDGMSFVYISELLRVTPGVRMEFGSHVIFKAEFTVNTELGRIPEFPNDVFTSALVVKY